MKVVDIESTVRVIVMLRASLKFSAKKQKRETGDRVCQGLN